MAHPTKRHQTRFPKVFEAIVPQLPAGIDMTAPQRLGIWEKKAGMLVTRFMSLTYAYIPVPHLVHSPIS